MLNGPRLAPGLPDNRPERSYPNAHTYRLLFVNERADVVAFCGLACCSAPCGALLSLRRCCVISRETRLWASLEALSNRRARKRPRSPLFTPLELPGKPHSQAIQDCYTFFFGSVQETAESAPPGRFSGRRRPLQRCWKFGLRFSRKAAMPSFWSRVANSA